jgi:recombination protein RecA
MSLKKEKEMEKTKEEKLKELRKITEKFNESAGKNLFRKASEFVTKKIPTGIAVIDYLTRGGLPRGLYSHIWSRKSVGKSSTMYAIIAGVQKNGGVAAYLDFEHSSDPQYMQSFGINMDELMFAQPENLEEGLDAFRAAIKIVDLIIIDSVIALGSQKENEKNMSESAKMADMALTLTHFFNRTTGFMDQENGPAVLLVNQTREIIGGMPGRGPMEKYSGGKSLEHSISFSMHLRRLAPDTFPKAKINGKEEEIGKRIEIKIDKTKIAGNEGESVAFDLLYAAPHIDNKLALIDIAMAKQLFTRRGAYYDIGGLSFMGKNQIKELLNVSKDFELALTNWVIKDIVVEDFTYLKPELDVLQGKETKVAEEAVGVVEEAAPIEETPKKGKKAKKSE